MSAMSASGYGIRGDRTAKGYEHEAARPVAHIREFLLTKPRARRTKPLARFLLREDA